MKFILLHEAKNEDGIRAFFMDVWELYVKVRPLRPGPELLTLFDPELINGANRLC